MGTSNGHHCPRCIGGHLFIERYEKYCLNCGYRVSLNLEREIEDYEYALNMAMMRLNYEAPKIRLRRKSRHSLVVTK